MKIALVTGANRGIGLEVCGQLANAGHTVLLTARDEDKARVAAASLPSHSGKILSHRLDITDATSIERARRWVDDEFGRLDVLVNNAAIDYDDDQDVLNADLDRARRILETNTFGAWRVTQSFLPLLRESEHARIVNVSSESGQLDDMTGSTPGYSMSKGALNLLTLMFSSALRGDRILVNSVCPGWVRTDMGGPDATRSVEEGASGVVWAATLPDDGPTGGFFRDGERLAW